MRQWASNSRVRCYLVIACAMSAALAAGFARAQNAECEIPRIDGYDQAVPWSQKIAESRDVPDKTKQALQARFRNIQAAASALYGGTHFVCQEKRKLVAENAQINAGIDKFNADKAVVMREQESFNRACTGRVLEGGELAACQGRRAQVQAAFDRVKADENRLRAWQTQVNARIARLPQLRANAIGSVNKLAKQFVDDAMKALDGLAILLAKLDAIIARIPGASAPPGPGGARPRPDCGRPVC